MATRRRVLQFFVPVGWLTNAGGFRQVESDSGAGAKRETGFSPARWCQRAGCECCDFWFVYRDKVSAELAAQAQEGTVVYLGGYPYEIDTSAKRMASATHDLGVDGLVPFGIGHPLHFGDLRRTSPIDLANGDTLRGDGARATSIINESSAAAIRYLGGSENAKHFGIQVSDLQVHTSDYNLGSGYGIETANQGYAFLSNTEVFGGREAAFMAQANVGQTTLNCHFARSRVAERLVNPSSILGNTAFRHFGLLRRVVETGVKNTGTMRGLKNLLGVWENFNQLNEQTDNKSIVGFLSLGEWFEAYGTNRVDFSSGKPTIGSHDGILVSEKMNMPLFWSSYFSAPKRFEGSFYPRIVGAHLTPKTSIGVMKFANQDSDKQFDFDATVTNWGKLASYGVESTLPKLGDWSDPDEKYYRQGVFNSIGVANHTGIWNGASGPCRNEFGAAIDITKYSKGGSWPYAINSGGELTVKSDQPDPYGGYTGVLIQNGLKICTNLVTFTGGKKWMTIAIIAKAQRSGDMLRMELRSVGGSLWSKVVKLEMPDTQWRIYHTHTYIPANPDANFRAGLGSDGGGVNIARAACFEGAELHPVLNYGQEVETGFRLVHGQVEVLRTVIPTGGKWYPGDRVRYAVPMAGGKIGAVCVKAGRPGVWKEYGSIDT